MVCDGKVALAIGVLTTVRTNADTCQTAVGHKSPGVRTPIANMAGHFSPKSGGFKVIFFF